MDVTVRWEYFICTSYGVKLEDHADTIITDYKFF